MVNGMIAVNIQVSRMSYLYKGIYENFPDSFKNMPKDWEHKWFRKKRDKTGQRIIAFEYDKYYPGIVFILFNKHKAIKAEDLKEWQIKINRKWNSCSEYLGGKYVIQKEKGQEKYSRK